MPGLHLRGNQHGGQFLSNIPHLSILQRQRKFVPDVLKGYS